MRVVSVVLKKIGINLCGNLLSHASMFQQDDETSTQRMHDHIRVSRVLREKDPSRP